MFAQQNKDKYPINIVSLQSNLVINDKIVGINPKLKKDKKLFSTNCTSSNQENSDLVVDLNFDELKGFQNSSTEQNSKITNFRNHKNNSTIFNYCLDELKNGNDNLMNTKSIN